MVPGKYQAIIIDKKGQPNNPTDVILHRNHIKSDDSVTLLGIEIDNELSFDKHISNLCNKSAAQLNALFSVSNFLGFEEKIANSSVKWTVLGHPRPKLNKIIFWTKPSGPVWASLSQIQ